MLNFTTLQKVPLNTAPFPHFAVAGVLDGAALSRIAVDFPAIEHAGVFPLSELNYGEAFAELIAEIEGQRLEALLEEKFGVTLSDKPLMITVRGRCHRRDGRIHTDSKDKFLTCLLYLNDSTWDNEGGRLRLLRSGADLDSVIAEVPPLGGNFVAFLRTDNSWHGHLPFEGPRRYIMFNWLVSDMAMAKNMGRHKLSAMLKRAGVFGGY